MMRNTEPRVEVEPPGSWSYRVFVTLHIQGVYTATWPRPSSCTSSWSPPSPSSRSPSALLSLSSLSPGWSAAAAASIALLVSYHRWVRRSPQRVTHQCHFTGAGAESAVTRAGLWSRMIANLRSCVTSRSDVGLVTQMSLSCQYVLFCVLYTVMCCAASYKLLFVVLCSVCLQLFSDLVWISRKPVRKSIITEKIFLPR